MKYICIILCCLCSSALLHAATPTAPTWANPAVVNTVNINGQARYWVETVVNGVTFKFWYIDHTDPNTNGQVDLGTRVQYSTRSNLPKLGAEPRSTPGEKGSAGGPLEYHPEGHDIWQTSKGFKVNELNYDKFNRPLYLLTDGVESIISGVRPYEFHLDALVFLMGEAPKSELDSAAPNYIANAAASNATVSGAVLKPMTVTLTKSYWMLEKEVSMAQWNAVMGSQPSNWPAPIGAPSTGNPRPLRSDGYCNYLWDDASNDPVTFITTDDSDQFLTQLNAALSLTNEATLPTEAEWEYACRIPMRNIGGSSAMARKRGMSDQDLPFAYGMHLYDPMKYYAVVDGTNTRATLAGSFHAYFDYRFPWSYNLPDHIISTADTDDVDNTAHYTRGFANNESTWPISPGDVIPPTLDFTTLTDAERTSAENKLPDPKDLWHHLYAEKRNAWGLIHMHGNVSEIVRDIWDGASPHHESFSATGDTTDYHLDFTTIPANKTASWVMKFHPTKGGSWMSSGGQCRASARGRILRYDLAQYPLINLDGSIDSSKPDPRCYTDTVGIRPIIYQP